VCVRVHISLDPKVVKAVDKRVGKRKRSAFIADTVRRALEDEQRWEDIEAAIGSIPDTGHVWDPDPAAWVHVERRRDPRRVG
jgi:hypothetical protein